MSDGKDAQGRKPAVAVAVAGGSSPEADTAKAEAGNARVEAQVNVEEEQGFRGEKVDPTPNEAYTVAGVTSGQPTPETDKDAARDAREARDLGGRL